MPVMANASAAKESESGDGHNVHLLAPVSDERRGSRASVESQLGFAERDQTILFCDWDDTLFPTTWFQSGKSMRGSQLTADAKRKFSALSKELQRLLELAKVLAAGVTIVTNAAKPWVEASRKQFLTDLPDSVFNGITVEYAREYLDTPLTQNMSPALFHTRLTRAKFLAMQSELNKFYSRYEKQSWKNIVNIGDGIFEHEAIRQVTQARPSPDKACRTKSIVFRAEPTFDQLMSQLRLLITWLPGIVAQNRDLTLPMTLSQEEVRKVTDVLLNKASPDEAWVS